MPLTTHHYKLTIIATLIGVTSQTSFAQDQQSNNNATLEQLVISASGYEQLAADAPASISVITHKDIERMPVTNISELLSDLPSVTGGYSNAGAGSKVSFRGMPSQYTLILVDGKRVGSSSLIGYRDDLVGQDLDWISPEMIERIEVVRGAMSTLYGSEAMGGVINIITRKVPTQWQGSITANDKKPDSSKFGDTKQIGANIAGPLNDSVGLKVGLNKTERDADTAARGSSGFDNKSINTQLNWRINQNHNIHLDLDYGIQKSESADNAEYEQFRVGELEHRGYGIGYEGTIGLVKNTINLYHNRYNNNDKSVPNRRGGFTTGDSESNETVLDAKSNLPFSWGVEQEATFGLQYKKEDIYNRATVGNQSKDKDGNPIDPELNPDGWAWSLFTEDQLYLQDNLTLTLGARLDKTDGFDAHLSPRAYIVYHPFVSWTVKGGVSQGFRAPTLLERSPSSGTYSRGNGCTSLAALGYQSGGCTMLGNPDLKPEVSTNYEIGVAFEKSGYQFDATYFYTDIKDLIQNNLYGIINGQWYTVQENVGAATTSGIESTFTAPVLESVSLKGNITYIIDSKRNDNNEPLLFVPELTGNLGVYWDVNDQLSAFSKIQYLGKQAYNSSDNASSTRFAKAYTTMDIGANYQVTSFFSVKAGIENVTNNVIRTEDDHGDGSPRIYYVGLTGNF